MSAPTDPHLELSPRKRDALSGPLFALFSCALALAVTGCATKPPVTILDRMTVTSDTERLVVNPRRFLPESEAALQRQGLLETARSDRDQTIRQLESIAQAPRHYGEALAAAELCFEEAYQLRESDPQRALGYALAATELAVRVVPRDVRLLSAEDDVLLLAYNRICRRVAELAHAAAERGETSLRATGPVRDYTLTWDTADGPLPHAIDIAKLDDVYAEDRIALRTKNGEYRQAGIGGAVVAYTGRRQEGAQPEPFVPPPGIAVPATAFLQFPRDGQALLTVVDALEQDTLPVNGNEVPLAADFGAPVAVLQAKSGQANLGLGGLLHPERYANLRGLYTLQRLGNGRIPLVFVHGLMSSPVTWHAAMNSVFADPVLRDHYQAFVFYYPTGLPIGYNAASFRAALSELETYERRIGPNPNFRRMVLVGHSMGGVLSSAQIRDSGDVGVRTVFTTDLESANLGPEEKARLREILVFDANPNVERVVFVCAPHRGSEMATLWPVRLASRLVQLPVNLIVHTTQADLQSISDELTGVGRTLFQGPTNSVQNLQPDAPVLGALLKMELNPRVTYHSIIGNRGKPGPLEDSSDGIVPYWSSHLDGAASEKIVPAPHSATQHPETVEELRRILYLHLGLPAPEPLPPAQDSAPAEQTRRKLQPPPHRR